MALKRCHLIAGCVFIYLHTRRIQIADIAPNLDDRWMAQAVRNMSMVFEEEKPEFRSTPKCITAFVLNGVIAPSVDI